MAGMTGDGQPHGTTRTLSYELRDYRYFGRVLYASFATSTDLGAWVPRPLRPVNPHEGFIKVYFLKRRPTDGTYAPPGFSHYREVCVTVLATAPGIDDTPRHYNLFMWLSHDWALYRAREVVGWPKKLADIEITNALPSDSRYDYDEGSRAYDCDVSRHGYRILSIRAELGDAEGYEPPPFDGFYAVRTLAAPQGAAPVSELVTVHPKDAWFSNPVYGRARVTTGFAPDEEMDLIEDIEVTGCALRDVGWELPGNAYRRIADVPQPLKPALKDEGDLSHA